jgi:hypothetical protein
MKTRLLAGLVATCAVAASAAPAFGDSEGTVTAQVSVAAPCIQATPAQLDFGSLGFSQSTTSPIAATRQLTLTSCAGGSQNVFARGTAAASPGGTAWTLEPNQGDLCSTLDRFAQRIGNDGFSYPLSLQNTSVAALPGNSADSVDAILVMPCVGSSGGGEVMTFSYLFTAVLG